jgi:hypothetical protein
MGEHDHECLAKSVRPGWGWPPRVGRPRRPEAKPPEHHPGDRCVVGHHGHTPGDFCQGRFGAHHEGDGCPPGDFRHGVKDRRWPGLR